jgi:hypothetical protein
VPEPANPETRLKWTLIADYALVDSMGKLSVVGIFDKLWAPVFPSLHPVLFLVAAWAGMPNQLVVAELRVWGPAKELLVGGQQQVQFGPDGLAQGIFRLSPLPLPAAGEYVLELLAGGISLSHSTLTVVQIEAS